MSTARPEHILVTGGSGRLGQAVMSDLLDAGYRVVLADRVLPATPVPPGVRVVQLDMSDVGHVAGVVHGCDAVIHLAAIPVAYRHPDEVVFTNNTSATFAVLQACSLLGIRRIALASSGSIYGTAYSPQPTVPEYVPVDENHPLNIADPYALSKQVDEHTARMFARKDGSSIACLRFHWIARREEQIAAAGRHRTDPNPEAEARNVWGYVDERDAARACRLAIERAKDAPYGCVVLNIDAADTISDTPTEELIRTHAPSIEIRLPLPGTTGAYDISRAREVIGWRPQHSWRDPE